MRTRQNDPVKLLHELHETSDLGCASALVASGFALISFDKSNPRRVVFRFAASPGLAKAVSGYWDGLLSVDARKHFESIGRLKSRIYNG
jgi:hypothetical protein